MAPNYQIAKCSRRSTICGASPAKLFLADEVELSLVEQGIAVDPRELQAEWQSAVHTALLDSGLQIPQKRPSAAAANGAAQ